MDYGRSVIEIRPSVYEKIARRYMEHPDQFVEAFARACSS
jgi:catalase (peroxidase I)